MKEHMIVLELAAQGKLPDNIDSSSNVSVAVVQELVDAGYLKAIDASSFDGVAYMEPRITLTGREYLAQLRDKIEGSQMKTKKEKMESPDSATKFLDPTDGWMPIEKEYDISKRSFGKRIGFVKDKFKRKILFRDIEQAFLLAHHGFNKPSVVLAGGVIEELLRLYLDDKGVRSERKTLDSYIKACEDNGLLKQAIHRLADSVRQFRNIVHLEREDSPRYSISKATAKGAVSSIFTIANYFDT